MADSMIEFLLREDSRGWSFAAAVWIGPFARKEDALREAVLLGSAAPGDVRRVEYREDDE